jgi:putative SOS response-associated peptidase YedK
VRKEVFRRYANRSRLLFLGLWDCWLDRDTGSQFYSFTIITTRANALVRRIHDRMPVIYDAAMGRQWLDGPFGARRMALDLVLQPLPSELVAAHEVSTLVNSPENDTAACVQAVSPGQRVKSQLPLL